jgi:hypothetical protein
MHVTKLRASANAGGLVPAGAYFATLSRKLNDTSAREHTMRALLDREDRDLETCYRLPRRACGRELNASSH